MKQALIISPYYAPSNLVAAIRATKFTKYLARDEGYSVDVISFPGNYPEDPTLMLDLVYVSVHIKLKSRFFSFVQRVLPNRQKAPSIQPLSKSQENLSDVKSKQYHFRKWFMEVALFSYEQMLAYLLYRSSKQFIRKNSRKYDLVFSTYGPYSSHMMGMYAKKCNPECFWIADFRDPLASGNESSELITKMKQKHVKKYCSQADAITAVSNGVLEKLDYPAQYISHVVTNGFDPDDLKNIQKSTGDKQEFAFAYCGTIYGGKSNLEVLFKALRELIQAGRVKKESFRIRYTGSEGAQVLRWALEYGLEDNLHDYGKVSRERSLEIQSVSSVLLLASWNNVGNTGVITGKFFEYLMMGKNILCFMSGNLANSDLKTMIETAEAGFCYEQANDGQDYCRLLEFLENTFNDYKENGIVRYSPNMDYINRFCYSVLTKELLRIADKCNKR